MREQLRRGRLRYITFVFIDLICLVAANAIAVRIYLSFGNLRFYFDLYLVVVIYMMAIDVAVTFLFNTLEQVLRRKIQKEIVESLKHVAICMLILMLLLFSMKQGSDFSRLTIYMAYGFYAILIVLARVAWKRILRATWRGKETPTALLVTTAGYANEGIGVIEKSGMTVKGIFITDKTNEGVVRNIPSIVDRQDATAFLCWEWIDKVYICGPDSIDVPDSLVVACRQMGIPVYTAPAKKSLDFEVVRIRTALQKDDNNTGLSFFESEHDIPFRISCFYTIFESEQENQRGFHAHKQSWHLLFCPYGSIDVMLDTGRERKTVNLSDPSIGLILHPSVWREMLWRKSGSVLCVAASGHYDVDKIRDDYGEYMKFLQEKEWSATIESAEILGDVVV